MGIWLNGVKNQTSNEVTLNLKGENRVMNPESQLQYNSVTDSSSSPFQANFPVEGVNRSFSIYDGGSWDLVVSEAFSADKQSLTVTRNYGEYALIILDKGIAIEDVSEGSTALAYNGQSTTYYKFFIENDHLIVEPSGSLD